MLRIVLIRPGSTDYVDQGRIQGTLDIPLNAGLIKFRTGDAWDENWGGLRFPDGQLSWFGDNIEVPSAGRYRITLDLEAETYSFERLGD